MSRTVALLGLVVVGFVLLALVEAPVRRSGPESLRGPRVFRATPHAIRRIDVAVGPRRLAAERVQGGWRVDGVPAAAAAAEALSDFATFLAEVRAVDAFRTADLQAFGLAAPAATITVTTGRDVQRLALGALNAGGSAVYARRGEQQRVMQVGTYLLSALDRVLAHREEAKPS